MAMVCMAYIVCLWCSECGVCRVVCGIKLFCGVVYVHMRHVSVMRSVWSMTCVCNIMEYMYVCGVYLWYRECVGCEYSVMWRVVCMCMMCACCIEVKA